MKLTAKISWPPLC